MDRSEIITFLEQGHGTSNPTDVSEADRWILYEALKSKVKFSTDDPDYYTMQIRLITDVLEL